ncbi:MAG: HK97 gp10 family phage protein [Oscillospiraceae bacterium]|nr:HK97 gp10 family phage protein [Oscillospiraceae bacterium]
MKEVEGFENFVRACSSLASNLQGSELVHAVKKGAKVVQKAIQTQAPVDTGELREGLILVKEKTRTRGKAVYQVTPARGKNAIFQKPIQNPVRSKSPYAYYPASQEYGYFTRRPGGGMTYVRSDGGEATMNKVPGKHYMRTGADVASETAKNLIAKSLLDTIAKKYGG